MTTIDRKTCDYCHSTQHRLNSICNINVIVILLMYGRVELRVYGLISKKKTYECQFNVSQ